MVQHLQAELLEEHAYCVITSEDQIWLSNFGVDASWHDNPAVTAELNSLIAIGSQRANGLDQTSQHDEIVQAREVFFDFIGIETHMGPTIVPIDTFIRTQRVMHNLGLNSVKIINALPSAISYSAESVQEKVANFQSLGLDAAKLMNSNPRSISYSPESVREKVANFTDLGLDAVKLINANSSAICYAPESVREKVANFTDLGLDAVKIINTNPSAIKFAPESVREKVANFTDLGLDAVKIIHGNPSAISFAPESVQEKVANFQSLGLDPVRIINSLPSAISYAPESVREKVANFTDLGLDAVKIIHGNPSAISFAPESVREKVRFLRRTSTFLRWHHDANEIIEAYPILLGFSTRKLQILRRIAAQHLLVSAREIEPSYLKSGLMIPLEKYVLTIGNDREYHQEEDNLIKKARALNIGTIERKEKAIATSMKGDLGRIGTMYLSYANQAA